MRASSVSIITGVTQGSQQQRPLAAIKTIIVTRKLEFADTMNLPRPSHGDNILQRVKFNTICGRTIFAAVIMVISVLRFMHLFKLGYIISGQWLVVMATKSVPSYTLDDSSHYYEQLHLQFAPHTCFSQATSWSPDKSQGQACLHCLQGRGFMC